jgi:hypothetical protein
MIASGRLPRFRFGASYPRKQRFGMIIWRIYKNGDEPSSREQLSYVAARSGDATEGGPIPHLMVWCIMRQDMQAAVRPVLYQTDCEEWPYSHGGSLFIVNFEGM